jgi:oxygen-independent coproporphyrinogen-3 oxidase
MAREVGFDNINLDLMFGLPNQTTQEALSDIQVALLLKPEHLSWYQLTLEPNTVFYKRPPKLPHEEKLWEIETEGKKLINQHYTQYEISAYSQPNRQARHNVNYWLFGDYIGIGAGAHGKITLQDQNQFTILRTQKKRQPADYLNPEKSFIAQKNEVNSNDILFEFMLNVLRLYQPIPYDLLEQRTQIPQKNHREELSTAAKKGFIALQEDFFEVTPLGHQYLNDLQEVFLRN